MKFKNKQQKPLNWKKMTVPVKKVMARIEPGMSIFIDSAGGEPRTLINGLMQGEANHLQDLELLQLISLGDAISPESLKSRRYRLKTFFSGWLASDAIKAGMVDLIPCRFYKLPELMGSGQLPVDVAFIQISPPDAAGYASLGVSVDLAHQAIARADLVVAEINPDTPTTYGDSFVSIDGFDFLVAATEPPLYLKRLRADKAMDGVARKIADIIDDGRCLSFSFGPLYEALSRCLMPKKDLGIHSPFFTDALMDLVTSGAVTNRKKRTFRGKSLTSYALGTPELSAWLHRNPLVEFQAIDKSLNPVEISKNPRFTAVFPARKVDLYGRIALTYGKGNITAGPAEVMNLIHAAEISEDGMVIFGLRSRNRKGESNIRLSVEGLPGQFTLMEIVDVIVTEHGAAHLSGRTIRERAQALIEIAHPDDRAGLIKIARENRILYPDQIFIEESAHLYPSEISTRHVFKNKTAVRFRAILPSDEEGMRRLFYRFSDQAVFYRYFTRIKAMPHARMQEYVNINYRDVLSIVGLPDEPGRRKIVAEGRYARHDDRPSAEPGSSSAYADVAFVVDEDYQGLGIATCLFQMLVRLARERGIHGFTADVLASNAAMMKVFEKGGFPVHAKLEFGVYHITIPFKN